MGSRKRTRATDAGVTIRGLRGRSKTKLQKVRRLLEQLAYEWGDVCSAYTAEVEALYQAIGELEGPTLDESLAWLAEDPEADLG
ncbi:hypothetical protein [Phenylobacterium sp.]|uniref:hypothetical protein n=1 Tax=Phenylobacterium sp. TaxID=1871053 RepID=UPI003919E5EE